MRTYPELSDWHLHSHFSSDSTETPENIIKNAINIQLKAYVLQNTTTTITL